MKARTGNHESRKGDCSLMGVEAGSTGLTAERRVVLFSPRSGAVPALYNTETKIFFSETST